MMESAEMKVGKKENHDDKRTPGPGRWSRFKAALAGVALVGSLHTACSNEESGGIPPIPTTDGGCEAEQCTDGGTGGTGGQDGGTGGHDGGTGGMDSGTGGHDSGTGGMDAGTGGMDSGTGGMDGGSGGMDSGTGGSDGGPVACATATTGSYSGLIANGSNKTVGGYVMTYNGVDGSGNAAFSVTCDGSPTGSYSLPEDVTTEVIVAADGKKLRFTPHAFNNVQTNIDIQVVNHP